MTEPNIKAPLVEVTPELMAEIAARRSCGTCAACCVHLGITELKKHSGQTCIHLKNGDPTKRCSIYDTKPKACGGYFCSWRSSMINGDFRPDTCGFIIDAHLPNIWVINIFDPRKAGALKPGSKLYDALQEILGVPMGTFDVRIIDRVKKQILHFTPEGEIFEGRILRNTGTDYESLNFTHDQNIGRYETKDSTP